MLKNIDIDMSGQVVRPGGGAPGGEAEALCTDCMNLAKLRVADGALRDTVMMKLEPAGDRGTILHLLTLLIKQLEARVDDHSPHRCCERWREGHPLEKTNGKETV